MNAIVFADISSEKAMIKGLIRNSVIIGFIGYVIFFLISLILAKWVTKPVEKTWNEQKQFIADASHELKTPLTVIMTNAEMMSDKSYSESDRYGFTRNILSTSKRMRGLVESLLELARLDNNRAQIKLETVNLSKLINDSILPFEPLFYENEMELSADIDDGVNVEGNKEKLRQVINILLDNALKYSDPADNVRVKLKRQGSECVLSVSGLGTPLTKEECVNIFKRFYRVDQARNDGQSYGLGLSIADSIIKEHNGKIWAESADGYNTFLVSLPL
jgi:signal transduction histidine kinase